MKVELVKSDDKDLFVFVLILRGQVRLEGCDIKG